MNSLTALRCIHHGSREAAALCASCRKPFCRECVTEHAGVVLCTGCLRQPERGNTRRLRPGLLLLSSCVLSASLVGLILLFALLGKTLLNLPAELDQDEVPASESGK